MQAESNIIAFPRKFLPRRRRHSKKPEVTPRRDGLLIVNADLLRTISECTYLLCTVSPIPTTLKPFVNRLHRDVEWLQADSVQYRVRDEL
jgi:hypothetical protein